MGLGSTSLSILAFFVVIGPLIFFHELGHFLAARWNNIFVEEFGIGYPPRIATLFTQKGTKFTLNWLPLGGFMRPAGEDDPSIEGGFASSPKLARLSVLAAGPGANIIVALLLLVIMYMIGAPVEQPGAQIALVEQGSPADAAGLQPGDIITAADDILIHQYDDLTEYIHGQVAGNPGDMITLFVTRGDESFEATMLSRVNPPGNQGPTGIRIQAVYVVESFGPVMATVKATDQLVELLRAFVEIPRLIIQQQIPARYLRPISVVGISQLGGQAIDASINESAAWPIIQLTAFISIALAVTNLLPLPALDGGRILFVLIEAVRGRRVDPERETLVHFIGFAILLTTMLVFVYLDIVDPLVVP